jgi:glucose-1-phosphate adenylyltransferase
MLFLDPAHRERFTRRDWPSRTPSVDAPPARFSGQGRARQSLIANGAVVRGDVTRSILFPGVVVEPGARVDRSILMNGTHVASEAQVEHAILDKRVQVGSGARIGVPGSPVANHRLPDLVGSGISLLGQDVVVEPGARVGGNVVIGGRRRVSAGSELADGSYVEGALPRILALRR